MRVAADTGARRGELAALKIGDLQGRVLHIARAASMEQVGPTKTRRSRRLTVGATTAELWHDLVEALVRRLPDGEPLGDVAVLLRPRPPHRLSTSHLAHSFARLRTAAAVPEVSLHRLRHGVATFLVDRGEILKAQYRLGHRDPSTTLRNYAHALPLEDEADRRRHRRSSRTVQGLGPEHLADCAIGLQPAARRSAACRVPGSGLSRDIGQVSNDVEPAFGGSYRSDDLSATAACEPRPYRAICSARGRLLGPCGEQICRTVPKDSVVARRCRGMGSVIVPGVDGGELVRAQFLAFYDAAVGPLFGYLYRASGGQRELAEDLCQDVFATVLTRVRGGDVSVLTVPWVIAVGRNRLIDQWRRSARQERRLSQLFTSQPVAAASVDDDLLAWIAQLPASQRAAVVLHYLDDLPVHEVADPARQELQVD